MTSTSDRDLSVAALCEAIWDTERELDLLDWDLWPVVRMRVFHELSLRSGLTGDAHPMRRSPLAKARLVSRHVSALLLRNPFLLRRRFEAAVVPHHRKIDGVEIYSEQLRSELGDRALILDSNINSPALPGSYTLDFFTSYSGRRSRPLDDPRVAGIEAALEKRTGIRLSLGALLGRELKKHHTMRRLYRRLLKRRGISTLYVVVSYFHQHIVGAARDLGIRVVELQHGAITPYHLGYSYPGRPAVPGQPDELWCFGSYWTETVELAAGVTTRVIGAPFVRRSSVAKNPSLVVFVSQGTIGPQLLRVATRLAESRPGLEIVFRLHPSEYRSSYPSVSGLRMSGGRGVPPGESTYDLMAAATYLVGVSTTALFEGMVLGCRTIVVDLPGAEYLAPAVSRGDALLVRDAGELARRLDDAPVCSDTDAYYATPLPVLTG
jgi:hypothetical protein